MVTNMTTIHDERAKLISRRMLEELAKAGDRLLEDDELGGKYLIRNEEGNGYRLGFKEGMGYEISFREVYRPDAEGVDEDTRRALLERLAREERTT